MAIKNNAQIRINSNNYLKLVSKRADWIKEQSDNNQAKVSLKFRQEGDQTLDTLTFLVEE